MIRQTAMLLLSAILLCAPLTIHAQETPFTVVIDAGHGGEDGGAVGPDGTPESGINLQIARRLDLLLRFVGQHTKMTRPDESAVYSPDAVTLREKKTSDLKNRVSIANAAKNGFLISIHQNSLPAHPAVHGAQVFYNGQPGASEAAMQVQQYLNQAVNPQKERVTKVIDGSIYLMKNTQHPAILVECGFMSNAAECKQLQSADHQLLLAVVIGAGFLQFSHA